jgi:hypothetical protein
MFKLTPVSSALAALMAAAVLSGCGGGDASTVSGPTPTSSGAQTTMDAPSKAMTPDAAAYFRIINEFNLANAEYRKVVVGQRGSLPAVPASFRAAAQALSLANTREVAELRAYGAWPQSVKPWIDQFIAQKVTLADIHHQMSVPAPGWDSWNSGEGRSQVGTTETARLSALIRQGLGLPPRATG